MQSKRACSAELMVPKGMLRGADATKKVCSGEPSRAIRPLGPLWDSPHRTAARFPSNPASGERCDAEGPFFLKQPNSGAIRAIETCRVSKPGIEAWYRSCGRPDS